MSASILPTKSIANGLPLGYDALMPTEPKKVRLLKIWIPVLLAVVGAVTTISVQLLKREDDPKPQSTGKTGGEAQFIGRVRVLNANNELQNAFDADVQIFKNDQPIASVRTHQDGIFQFTMQPNMAVGGVAVRIDYPHCQYFDEIRFFKPDQILDNIRLKRSEISASLLQKSVVGTIAASREISTTLTNNPAANGRERSIKSEGGMGLLKIDSVTSQSLAMKNPFLSMGSPSVWFDRTKHYKRTDEDNRIEKVDDDAPIVSRRYFSQDCLVLGRFGFGWHDIYESRIAISNSTLSRLEYWDHSGSRIKFAPNHNISDLVAEVSHHFPGVDENTRFLDLIAWERKTGRYFLSEIRGLVYLGIDLDVAQLRFRLEDIEVKAGSVHYTFGRNGRLKAFRKGTKSAIELSYDPIFPERIVLLKSAEGSAHRIQFNYTTNGLVSQLRYEDGTEFSYRYDEERHLLGVMRGGTLINNYGYDPKGRLNTIKIADDEPLNLTYNDAGWIQQALRGESKYVWKMDEERNGVSRIVKTHWERTEKLIEREYLFDSFSGEIRMKDSDSINQYTVYHLSPCGCSPLDVTIGNKKLSYAYDEFGNIILSSGTGITKRLSYNPIFGKVSSVTEMETSTGKTNLQTAYLYDHRGNLLTVQFGETNRIDLSYDTSDRVETISDTTNERLSFRYNDRSKPTEINIPGLGVINVTYTKTGEVDKVDSVLEPSAEKDGKYSRTLALRVTSQFQRLLDAIRPAEVKINRDYTSIDSTP